MNTIEELRLECLKLAVGTVSRGQGYISNERCAAEAVVVMSNIYYDFITGTDRAALADEAKAAVDRAVR